jgi:DNA-binding NarL/FixJ family response regulator
MRKIVSLSPEATTVDKHTFKKISEVLGFEPIVINNLQDLFNIVNQDSELSAVLLNIDENIFNIVKQDSELSAVLLNIDENITNMKIVDIINSIETLRQSSGYSRVNVLAYSRTDMDTDNIRKIIRSGISGFAIDNHMTFEDKIEFMTDALSGHKYLHKNVKEQISTYTKKKKVDSVISLTPRQEQVLELICSRGSSNKNIARILHLSESTVKLHIGAILKKYGLTNRTQLALFAKNK